MPKILVLYHFHRPDDVAGAVHFTGLCEGLVERGWQVEAWPSNRSCHHDEEIYRTKTEILNGVTLRRVWRPAFNQHSFLGRIANSAWILSDWCLRALTSAPPDVVLTGTDPLFGMAVTPFFKWRYPKAKMVHWCFDLYPEYPIADGLIKEKSASVGIIRWFLKKVYKNCDLVADLGPRMRDLLERYPTSKRVTLTPWAQEEPSKPLVPDMEERENLFGKSPLGILYSGNFGRPHGFDMTLQLARQMRGQAVFAYSARGSRLEELKAAITPEDGNIVFKGFAPANKLAARLSAPDVLLVSLTPHWTGVAVPSKFFGALAVGRPVLFEGDENSDIALWIKEYGVGWVLAPDRLTETATELQRFAASDSQKKNMFTHCHQIYQQHFSMKSILDGWDKELRTLLSTNS